MVDGKLVNSVGVEQSTGVTAPGLETAAAKTVVVALGNPYVLRDFSNAQNYVCTYSGASTSELSAVKYLFGELGAERKIAGHSARNRAARFRIRRRSAVNSQASVSSAVWPGPLIFLFSPWPRITTALNSCFLAQIWARKILKAKP